MRKRNHWPSRHFSIALPQEKLPTLLRRVAKHIELIDPDVVLDIVVKTDYQDMVATVYFSGKRKPSVKSVKRRSRRAA
jgi:hypothetical protein